MTDKDRIERTECADLSERLHELAGKFDALGWERHGSEIRSMAAHIGIYGRQLAGRKVLKEAVLPPRPSRAMTGRI